MTDGEALRQATLSHPLDEVRRFVYADWLEEEGEQKAADWLRDFGKGMTWVDMLDPGQGYLRRVRFGVPNHHLVEKHLAEIRQRKSDGLWECGEWLGHPVEAPNEHSAKYFCIMNALLEGKANYAPQGTRAQAAPSSPQRRQAKRQRAGL